MTRKLSESYQNRILIIPCLLFERLLSLPAYPAGVVPVVGFLLLVGVVYLFLSPLLFQDLLVYYSQLVAGWLFWLFCALRFLVHKLASLGFMGTGMEISPSVRIRSLIQTLKSSPFFSSSPALFTSLLQSSRKTGFPGLKSGTFLEAQEAVSHCYRSQTESNQH